MDTTSNPTNAPAPTVRVVFDGPPFAGKTTAARALSAALGNQVLTPAEEDGRTVWFDWMAYSAGHHAGQPVRVELVTVPGQAELVDRRRHLLAWGDVVVFVANTSEAVFADSVASFAELRAELARRPRTPIVVVANKRDLMDAVPMDDVVIQLGLSADDIVIEGVATTGGGIQEAFVHAVNAALERLDLAHEAGSADDLLEEMQALGPEAPVDEAPVDETPVDETPVDETPVDETPVDETPVDEAPADEAAAAEDLPESAYRLAHPRLNPDAIADGDAIVVLAEHWRTLVDVATNGGALPRTEDPREAVVVAELAAWGLLTDEAAAPQSTASAPVAPGGSEVFDRDDDVPAPIGTTPAAQWETPQFDAADADGVEDWAPQPLTAPNASLAPVAEPHDAWTATATDASTIRF